MSASTTSLLDLPLEMVEVIVTHPTLGLVDIYRVSATCSTILSIVNRSWSKIANSRWGWWGSCTAESNAEWRSLCRERYCCERELDMRLYQTVKRGVRQYLTDDEELEVYKEMISDKGCCSQQIMDCVLREILNKGIRNANLTHQYYARCIYEYLKRQQLKKEWKELLNKKKQLLIAGAVLISRWIDPLNTTTEIIVEKEISTIAEQTAQQLIPSLVGDDSRVAECTTQTGGGDTVTRDPPPSAAGVVRGMGLPRKDILEAVNKVMFNQLGYKAATNDYYHLENSLIEKVLDRRRGIPITLSAVYQAVANQLGVELLPVNFPAHFLLKSERDLNTGEGEVFVDPFNKGELLSQSDCLNLIPFINPPQPEVFNAVPSHRAIMRMVANIYSRGHFGLDFDVNRRWLKDKWGPLVLPSALSLQLFLCNSTPVCDFTSIVAADAADVALDLRYNTHQVNWVMSYIYEKASPSVYVLTKLQKAQYLLERRKKALSEATRVKHRDTSKVIYTVGMIMKHLRYDYLCVIYGWDTTCEMSEQWIKQMGVHQLLLGPTQPFYNVLVDDGTNRYAAQESLTPCPPAKLCHITHWEVGKYFKHFTGTKYIPNHALLEKYPN